MAFGISSAGPYSFDIGSLTGQAAFPAVVVIDRTRDLTGAITPYGNFGGAAAWISTSTPATAPSIGWQYYSYSLAAYTVSDGSAFPVANAPGFGSVVDGTVLYPAPIVMASPEPQPQLLAAVMIGQVDILPGQTFTAHVLGSDHSYLACSSTAGLTRGILASARNVFWSLGLRYE
jgi:hypothetical protein